MQERTIVALRGYMASGKSTAFANLRLHKKMKNWIFIDFEAIRQMFNNDKINMIKYSNSCFFAILKELMKTKKNILTQEVSEQMLMGNIGKTIKQNKYKVQTITLIISPENSYLRATERRKIRGLKPRSRKEIYESYRNRQKTLSKEKTLIDVNNLSKKQVVDDILKLIL